MTKQKRVEQLEQVIQPAGEKEPLIVLWSDPHRRYPGYWRARPPATGDPGEPLTEQEIEELGERYESIFLVDYTFSPIAEGQ